MNIKIYFLILIFTSSIMNADQSSTQQLLVPNFGGLFLTDITNNNVTKYFLTFKALDKTEIQIWSSEFTADPQSFNGFHLSSCVEDSNKLFVLLIESDSLLHLLRFDLKTKVLKDETFSGSTLYEEKIIAGGELKLTAHDRISLIKENKVIKTWSFVDSSLVDSSGNVIDEDLIMKIRPDKDKLRNSSNTSEQGTMEKPSATKTTNPKQVAPK